MVCFIVMFNVLLDILTNEQTDEQIGPLRKAPASVAVA